MEVSKIQFYQNNQFFTPTFCGSSRQVGKKVTLDGLYNLKNNYTRIGRDEECLSRKELVNHILRLTDKKDAPVEILFCGCSDGSEPIDITMELLKILKIQGRQFPENLKLTAFDRDEVMVNAARTGRLNLTKEEIEYIKKNRYYNFINNIFPVLKLSGDENLSEYVASCQFTPEVMDKINFRQGELIKEIESLDPNTHKIVFCRNVAIYLPYEEQRQIAELLNQKLRPDSLLICGSRDTDMCDPKNADNVYKSLKYGEQIYTVRKGIFSDEHNYYWSVPTPFIEAIEHSSFKNNRQIGCAYQKIDEYEQIYQMYKYLYKNK